jgi:hypothetical protein
VGGVPEHFAVRNDPRFCNYSLMNSAYQRVELIKDEDGKLYLYLDGLLNLNASDLKGLNYYMAEIPAQLISSLEAQILIEHFRKKYNQIKLHNFFGYAPCGSGNTNLKSSTT